jgi:hypothetical protein
MRLLLTTLFLCGFYAGAQVCNPNGNIIIFSNYDGGFLNINVDVDIPNLKIGVVSYEAVEVTLQELNMQALITGRIQVVGETLQQLRLLVHLAV